MIEEGEERVVEAGGVEEEDGLGVELEGLPGENLEELFHGAKSAGEDDEGIGSLAHEGFAGVHGIGYVEFGESVVGDFEVHEDFGDDSDDVASRSEGQRRPQHA